MYGMTPMGVFFTAIFPLVINGQALCQQPHFDLFVEADWDIERGVPEVSSYAEMLTRLCNPQYNDGYID